MNDIIIKPDSSSIAEKEFFPETPDIETSSEGYARRFSGRVGEWFLEVQEKATLRMLSDWPRASILDVGGGHGQLTNPLLRDGFDVTVLGSSIACQERINDCVRKCGCKFKVGNVLSLPFEDNSFDIVISFRLLPHIENWPQLIAEFARVAKKAVIVDYPTTKSVNILTPLMFKFKKQIEGNTRQYTLFTEREILDEFKMNNFIVAEKFSQFLLPMVFHRALKSPTISSSIEGIARFIGLTKLFGSPIIKKFVPEVQ